MGHERCFLIEEKVPQGWSFQSAAARFFATRNEFLKVDAGGLNPVGTWELTCFPFKEFVGKQVDKGDIWKMRKLIALFRNYDDSKRKYYVVKGVEDLFKTHLAHPPMPLSLSQDHAEVERRSWAIKMFWEGRGFHPPPKR